MKVGDLVKFVGSWDDRLSGPRPGVGIIMETWTNGRTRHLTSADVLYGNGTFRTFQAHHLEVMK